MRVCSRIGLAPYLRLRRRADHRDLAQPLHRPPAGTCCQVCTSTARFSTSRRAWPAGSSGRESPRSGEYALGVETPNSGRLRANREAEMRPKPGALGIDGKDRHRCITGLQQPLPHRQLRVESVGDRLLAVPWSWWRHRPLAVARVHGSGLSQLPPEIAAKRQRMRTLPMDQPMRMPSTQTSPKAPCPRARRGRQEALRSLPASVVLST